MATISHENRFIFIHVEKTGGSSMNNAIFKNGHVNADVDINKKTGIINFKQPQYRNTEYYGGDSSAKQCIDIFGRELWDDYFTFAFVRNPWDRMLSWYKYLIDVHYLHPRVSLKDWILNYDFRDKMRQTDYLLDHEGKICLDFVGRYENLQQDFDFICEKINIPKQKMPHINKSSDRTPYYEYYDEDTKNLIAHLFAEEINLLGYKYEPTSKI